VSGEPNHNDTVSEDSAAHREPYVRPLLEQFPPMHDVTFTTEVPVTATTVSLNG
jgi:hypothetical protein